MDQDIEFTYSTLDKPMCWYNSICDHKKCSADTFCIRNYKMSTLVSMLTMEGKQRYLIQLKPDKVDLDSYKHLKLIKDNILKFVSNGNNLLIYSTNTGNGKTEWAKKLLLSWFDSIWSTTDIECRGLWISMPKFIPLIKLNISSQNDYFCWCDKNLLSADLVVFDEINYKDWTPFEQDYMLNIVSQRLLIGKSTIYTTNYNLDDVLQKLGSRLASRIIGSSDCVEFKGSDKRCYGKGVING